jgi:glyoxylate/hydroxypyruvate reductase
MTFLFNSDAERGTVFRNAFARELPHLPFAIDPASVDTDLVRYIMKSCSQLGPGSINFR